MNRKRRSRTAVGLAGMAAAMTAAALHAAPALAAAGSGEAAISVASHSKGRTLSGQGVNLLAGEGATGKSGKLSLPIGDLNPGAPASAQTPGTLKFKRGKKALMLTGIRFELSTATLVGKLGGVEMPVFRLGGTPAVNGVTGSIGLSESQLKLTEEAASALKQKLGLAKALRSDGVGMLWLSAQAAPTYAAPQPVTSGGVSWGVLASWRKYVLTDSPAPGPPDTGEVALSDGATSNGDLVEPSGFFAFPAVGGSFQKGLYGAADKLTLKTQGAVDFAKPMHCIDEVLFSGIQIKLDGTISALSLDAKNEIGKFNGMACEAQPPVPTAGVLFATLAQVTPTYSGNTVTWSAIPSNLTAAGSSAWGVGPPYTAGKVLDAVSITVGLG
ncbi:MAG TPA: HtaA domain-containing protein [Solirubrobacterales bacterium]|nr:HtaA domain-containing protein [Solirubrobacterales bacterium]